MRANKKRWLLPLLALGELILIVILAPANCGHDTIDKKPPDVECQKIVAVVKEEIGACVTDPMEGEVNDETDDSGRRDVLRSCATVEDCGCGYDCIDNQCHKLDYSCCANADCGIGLTCVKKESDLNGTCMLSQCDTDAQCGGKCGTHCVNHRCKEWYCCVDTDCSTGEFCQLFDDDTKGYCEKYGCVSDADCGCGKVCSTTKHFCNYYSPDRPISCCGTDFYYKGVCILRTYIENGNCLEDAHCPAGKVCVGSDVCFPATCTDNASCGCEAVCRKGRCERGCDENDDCCSDGYICDRGECFDPNEPDEEDYRN